MEKPPFVIFLNSPPAAGIVNMSVTSLVSASGSMLDMNAISLPFGFHVAAPTSNSPLVNCFGLDPDLTVIGDYVSPRMCPDR